MKIFIAALVLIFSLTSLSKANDIYDFEIEGMGLGGSLLEFFNEDEVKIVLAKNPSFNTDEKKATIDSMVRTAELTRSGFVNGDIATVMSPRTVIMWAENTTIFGDVGFAFRITFLSKCDELERPVIEEYFQRCFGVDIVDAKVANVKE